MLNAQAIKFQILDNVTTSAEVFDNLISVKHLITNETGLLLCSHYSRWPENLIEKATWLAGCLTPANHLGNPKLVFGDIPTQIINWEICEETHSIIIYIHGKVSNTRAMGQQLTRIDFPAQEFAEDFLATDKVKARLEAIKRLLFSNNELPSTFIVIKGIYVYLKSRADFSETNSEAYCIAQTLGLFLPEEDCVDYYQRINHEAYEMGFICNFIHKKYV